MLKYTRLPASLHAQFFLLLSRETGHEASYVQQTHAITYTSSATITQLEEIMIYAQYTCNSELLGIQISPEQTWIPYYYASVRASAIEAYCSLFVCLSVCVFQAYLLTRARAIASKSFYKILGIISWIKNVWICKIKPHSGAMPIFAYLEYNCNLPRPTYGEYCSR